MHLIVKHQNCFNQIIIYLMSANRSWKPLAYQITINIYYLRKNLSYASKFEYVGATKLYGTDVNWKVSDDHKIRDSFWLTQCNGFFSVCNHSKTLWAIHKKHGQFTVKLKGQYYQLIPFTPRLAFILRHHYEGATKDSSYYTWASGIL